MARPNRLDAEKAARKTTNKKKPQADQLLGAFYLEAEVGIEPAFTDLQSGA